MFHVQGSYVPSWRSSVQKDDPNKIMESHTTLPWCKQESYRDVIRHFHYNVAHDLLQRNNTVICPTTGSHKWRQKHKLPSVVKRRSQVLRFGLFAQRLIQTCTKYKNKRIIRGSEAYTSIQCGLCGHLNRSLCAKEEFNCSKCDLKNIDRDIHAARNILLRFLI